MSRASSGSSLEIKCPYCGQKEHSTEFSCPRIKSLSLDEDGKVVDIIFFRDYLEEIDHVAD